MHEGREPRIQQESWLEKKKREARSYARLAALGVGMTVHPEHNLSIEPESGRHVEAHAEYIDPYFDNNPEYFREVENGEFSTEERKERTKSLPHGEVIFEDIGLTFYKVVPGDTINGIKEKLGRYPEYEYLKKQNKQIYSFNIAPETLQAGMWLPIPLDKEHRELTDEQFKEYMSLAIHDMERHEKYGPTVQKILQKTSEKELIASLTAVAKQESGRHIGDAVLQRYEPKHRVFSYSYFHILMEKAGLRARRNLNMTEGQIMHPENAGKLFLAFLTEQTRGSAKTPTSFFPLDRNSERFASFYNGSAWRTYNPTYAEHIKDFYREALHGKHVD